MVHWSHNWLFILWNYFARRENEQGFCNTIVPHLTQYTKEEAALCARCTREDLSAVSSVLPFRCWCWILMRIAESLHRHTIRSSTCASHVARARRRHCEWSFRQQTKSRANRGGVVVGLLRGARRVRLVRGGRSGLTARGRVGVERARGKSMVGTSSREAAVRRDSSYHAVAYQSFLTVGVLSFFPPLVIIGN